MKSKHHISFNFSATISAFPKCMTRKTFKSRCFSGQAYYHLLPECAFSSQQLGLKQKEFKAAHLTSTPIEEGVESEKKENNTLGEKIHHFSQHFPSEPQEAILCSAFPAEHQKTTPEEVTKHGHSLLSLLMEPAPLQMHSKGMRATGSSCSCFHGELG